MSDTISLRRASPTSGVMAVWSLTHPATIVLEMGSAKPPTATPTMAGTTDAKKTLRVVLPSTPKQQVCQLGQDPKVGSLQGQ